MQMLCILFEFTNKSAFLILKSTFLKEHVAKLKKYQLAEKQILYTILNLAFNKILGLRIKLFY